MGLGQEIQLKGMYIVSLIFLADQYWFVVS